MDIKQWKQFRDQVKEKLTGLPRRAVVAFAARCARRVQPLFVAAWPDAPQKHLDAIEKAIVLAERYGQGDKITAADAYADAYADAVAYAARAADARAAAAYADAAAYAAYAAHAADAADAYADAAYAARAAAAYADAAVGGAPVIEKDLQRLLDHARRKGWTEDSKVIISPDFFGPMWPDGEPQGWPESAVKKKPAKEQDVIQPKRHEDQPSADEEPASADARVPDVPPIELYIDPGDAPKETVQAVFDRFSDLHRAAGGLGLEYEIDGLYVYAREKVPT